MKEVTDNPILSVSARDVEWLRSFSAEAEATGQLTDDQLAIIYDKRWFKLFVPRALGGLELTLPDGVRLEEELARIDGSLGWTVTLCAGANMFVGFMDQSIAPAIFSGREVCLGGSGQPSGRAVIGNGGFKISGTWNYATGAPHLTHFTANCVLERNGEVLVDQGGNPVISSFFFPRDHVRIKEDWNAFGLTATASHSFTVDTLWVNESQAFVIAPDKATLDHPIYRYPFLQLAEATLAANTLGMAQHFLACATTIGSSVPADLLYNGGRRLIKARTLFYAALDASWDELLHNDIISPPALQAVSDQSRAVVSTSREEVVRVYPLLGLIAADGSSEINRIWRDMFTASQHSLLRS
ncbi:acyl-CoA dehydrogenase [Parapedobacter deserti]|uniref:Acyl-CoA dehydrogenase n=1 Tax=Parapedobacter deserti TaxID=1912957 RepID=A0ABV7JJJ2_9SPHI